jgi:hypothetical protein
MTGTGKLFDWGKAMLLNPQFTLNDQAFLKTILLIFFPLFSDQKCV